jgi:hypothetical protein
LTHDTFWVSPKQARTVQASSTAKPFNATGYFTEDQLVFDTGYPNGGLWIPHADFLMLVGLAGAFDSTGNGNWEFPCTSTMSFNFLGSQGVTYAIPLADVNSPGTAKGYCYALAADGGGTTSWYVLLINK